MRTTTELSWKEKYEAERDRLLALYVAHEDAKLRERGLRLVLEETRADAKRLRESRASHERVVVERDLLIARERALAAALRRAHADLANATTELADARAAAAARPVTQDEEGIAAAHAHRLRLVLGLSEAWRQRAHHAELRALATAAENDALRRQLLKARGEALDAAFEQARARLAFARAKREGEQAAAARARWALAADGGAALAGAWAAGKLAALRSARAPDEVDE